MANFSGQLNSNEIFSALYNMIISQQVFADPIKGTNASLVDENRVDGSLYGDTKLYYSTDVLTSYAWGNDSEASNLLNLYRPAAPDCQAIELDVFRYIPVTVDNYLSKRAWGTEGAFNEFNSVMLGWLRNTKKVYDSTTFNAFIGTNATNTGSQTQTITLPEEVTHYYDGTDADSTDDALEATNRLQAQAIAEKIANIFTEVTDVSRDYNDYGNMRSFDKEELEVVWNADWVNKIKAYDLPTMFHKEGLIEKFEEKVLPAKYFGTINTVSKTTADSNTRALKEITYTNAGGQSVHLFAGEAVPSGDSLVSGGAIVIPSYQVDPTVVCKIMKKGGVPYMSAFETETNFFNNASLTETHRLIFGHNTIEHLKEYPFITVKATTAA